MFAAQGNMCDLPQRAIYEARLWRRVSLISKLRRRCPSAHPAAALVVCVPLASPRQCCGGQRNTERRGQDPFLFQLLSQLLSQPKTSSLHQPRNGSSQGRKVYASIIDRARRVERMSPRDAVVLECASPPSSAARKSRSNPKQDSDRSCRRDRSQPLAGSRV